MPDTSTIPPSPAVAPARALADDPARGFAAVVAFEVPALVAAFDLAFAAAYEERGLDLGRDMTAEVRKITVARTEGENSVLAGGTLAKDEKVVVRGALRLAPGTKVTIADPGAAS